MIFILLKSIIKDQMITKKSEEFNDFREIIY